MFYAFQVTLKECFWFSNDF